MNLVGECAVFLFASVESSSTRALEAWLGESMPTMHMLSSSQKMERISRQMVTCPSLTLTYNTLPMEKFTASCNVALPLCPFQ